MYLSYDRRVRQYAVQLGSKFCFDDLCKAVQEARQEVIKDQFDPEDVEVEVQHVAGQAALTITIKTAAGGTC